MQFLKTLFWVILAVVAVVFALNNWTVVSLALWGGLRLDAKLPVLLLLAWALGFLPMYAISQTTRWRLRRRLDAAERALATATAPATVPVEPPLTVAVPSLGP